MLAPADSRHTQSQERRSALILPREHGAWGILLIPLCTGVGVAIPQGGRVLPVVLFLLAALTLFWMRTPVESWLGTSPMRAQSKAERWLVQGVTAGLGCVALALLAALFWQGRNSGLLLLGAAAAAAFVAQAILKKLGRSTRVLSQIIGAIGLTCTAPGAYYVATTHFGPTAWGLWLANWIFAANQVHYVQTRIRGAKLQGFAARCAHGAGFLEGHVAAIGLLLIALSLRWLPGMALLAFVPALVRGIAWFFGEPEILVVRRIGWTELCHALFFGTLLIAAFYLGR